MENKYFIMRGDEFWTHDFDVGPEPWTGEESKAAKYSGKDALAQAKVIANNEGQAVDVAPVDVDGPDLCGVITVNPEDRFVTAYAVTREYGGREEGGWWYNAYHALASIPLDSVTADEAKAFLAKAYAHIPEGGTELSIIAEWEKGSQQRPRPRYE